MAVDRAVLSARDAGTAPPTLRLYRWRVPTITLGRFQRLDDVDFAAVRELGFDVVRRPTGGRGVLHDHELTYSVVANAEDGVPRGTARSYAHLCGALVEAYRHLGVNASLTERERGAAGSGACYLHATRADLSFGVAKLSGSAQVWGRDSVLQHGSFVISRDLAAEARVFHLDEDAAARLAASTRTLTDILGHAPSEDEVRDAVVVGFERAFGIELVEGNLTNEEAEEAERLVAEYRVAST